MFEKFNIFVIVFILTNFYFVQLSIYSRKKNDSKHTHPYTMTIMMVLAFVPDQMKIFNVFFFFFFFLFFL